MFALSTFGQVLDSLDSCPWGAAAGRRTATPPAPPRKMLRGNMKSRPLYTPEEKRRRDKTPWTLVQGVLAPVQFAIFLVSLALVIHFLTSGTGEQAATLSVVVKTAVLYAIMVTGAVWEKAIFGQYLFARAFFWEDAMSMVVVALHTTYLAALLSGAIDSQHLMLLALTAYAAYLINAGQFVLKLRAARLADQNPWHQAAQGMRRI